MIQEYKKKYPQLFKAYLPGRDIEIGQGWVPIVDELLDNLSSTDIEIVQIKQKFAELRIYYNGDDDKAEDLIYAANIKCSKTCEFCGAPGKEHSNGWLFIKCDQHLNATYRDL